MRTQIYWCEHKFIEVEKSFDPEKNRKGVYMFTARQNDEKIARKNRKSQLCGDAATKSKRHLYGLPGRFRLKIERRTRCTHLFCPKTTGNALISTFRSLCHFQGTEWVNPQERPVSRALSLREDRTASLVIYDVKCKRRAAYKKWWRL